MPPIQTMEGGNKECSRLRYFYFSALSFIWLLIKLYIVDDGHFFTTFFIITSCKVAKAFNELKANLSSKKKNRSQGESQRKAVELSQEVCSKFINLNNACLLNLES